MNRENKKIEISVSTMINSVERDVSELLRELKERSQKTKIISIQETLKIILRKVKLKLEKEENIVENEFNLKKSVYDGIITEEEKEYSSRKIQNELKRLKEEKEKFENDKIDISKEFSKKLFEKDEILKKQAYKIEQLNMLNLDEKSNNKHLMIQLKRLEEKNSAITEEYSNLRARYDSLFLDSESAANSISKVNKNNSDNKAKIEELSRINNDLKQKILHYENSVTHCSEEIKSLLRKNGTLNAKIEEVENKNKEITSELAAKEERLRALRQQNSQLEQKSNKILKKINYVQLFETQNSEVSTTNRKLIDIIEDLTAKYKQEAEEANSLRRIFNESEREKSKISADFDELRKQLSSIRSVNQELNEKNTELENKFKNNFKFASQSLREYNIDEFKPAKLHISNDKVKII
jgi:chromosome segregation ATPase